MATVELPLPRGVSKEPVLSHSYKSEAGGSLQHSAFAGIDRKPVTDP